MRVACIIRDTAGRIPHARSATALTRWTPIPPNMPNLMRSRYMLGFSFAAGILLLIGLAIMLATQQFRHDSEMVQRTYDVLSRIEALRASMLSGISAQRSYLLTGTEEYREDFFATRPQVAQDLAALSGLLADHPGQNSRAKRLASLIDERLDLATEGIRIYQQQDLRAAQAYSRNNRGLDLMKDIRLLMDQMVASERELLDTRTTDTERGAWLLLGLGALGIPLSLSILTWIYVLLSREVRERERAESDTLRLNQDLSRTVLGLERSRNDLKEIGHYAGILQGCRKESDALDATQRTFSKLLPACAGAVYLIRASQDYAESAISWGEHVAGAKPLLPPEDCWALRRGKPHVVDDIYSGTVCDHFALPADRQPVSTACLPLSSQNTSLGFLAFSRPGGRPISRLDTASAAAEQLSLALGNLRLQERLRQQSIRDALTGLYNRRYLEESLSRELSRCERSGQPLALMMLDLDQFKVLNDAQGHEAGDTLLVEFGRLLESKCRNEDIACRYGGEEFTVILPGVDLEVARQRADEIRTACEVMTISYRHRTLGGMTVSIGLAMFPDQAADGTELQQIADAALYRAKRAGRNRVEIATSS